VFTTSYPWSLHKRKRSTLEIPAFRFITMLSFYLRCDVIMKNPDCMMHLARHKILQYKDNLCTNVRQSGRDRSVRWAVCVPNLQKRPDSPWGPLSPYPIITNSSAHTYCEAVQSSNVMSLLRITGRYLHCPCTPSWHGQPQLYRQGHAVAQLVEALRYKPEVCGFHSRL
jgi:hypothetical protein